MNAPWLQTQTGRAFPLTDLTPDNIDFRVIATVLARVPRFGGHTRNGILSVAQHCVEGAHAIKRDTGRRDAAGAFLLHDAHEAYIGDIATPVAEALVYVADQQYFRRAWGGECVRDSIRALKSALDHAIHLAAGMPWPLPADVRAIVHEYDLRMCRTERDARMTTPPKPWADAIEEVAPVEGVDLSVWSEEVSRMFWLGAFHQFVLGC